MTQTDMQPDASVEAAARWLAGDPIRDGAGIVPTLKTRFGITTPEAIESIRLAAKIRRAAHGNP